MSSLSPSEAPVGVVVLLGSGGHARVVVSSLDRVRLVAVIDPDPSRVGAALSGVVIQAAVGPGTTGPFHIAVGANAARRRIAQGLAPATRYLSIRHADSRVAPDAVVGDGAFIGLGAILQTGVRIGRHAIVNTGAIVDHDGRIGDFAHVAPGAVLTGGVSVGQEALIGAGAVVLPGVRIGDGAVIGAGAVVTHDVAPGTTVVGRPARPVVE